MNTRLLVSISLMGAIGMILQFFAIPLPFMPEYLTYDTSDVPALIMAFAVSPWVGVMVALVKNLLSLALGNSPSGLIGITANFLAGGSFALIAGYFYFHKKTRKNAFLGLIMGGIFTTGVMGILNYFWLLPLWGVPQEAVLPLLKTAILPFNLIKGLITGAITFTLYKKVKNFIAENQFNDKSCKSK